MPHLKTFALIRGTEGHIPWGQLPRYSIHMLVEKKDPPPPVERKRSLKLAKASTWKLEESIFAPRRKDCDAKAFLNDQAIHDRMMAQDLKLCAAMPRYPKFVARLAGNRPDGAGSDAVDAALREHLSPMYHMICNAMEYYGYRTTNDDPFDMAANAYHAFLKDAGRAQYAPINNDEALAAFSQLSRTEGIIPALEPSHAVALAIKLAKEKGPGKHVVVNLCGRGDKDMITVAKALDVDLDDYTPTDGKWDSFTNRITYEGKDQ